MDLIQNMFGQQVAGAVLENIAKKFGIEGGKTSKLLAMAMPLILAGLAKKTKDKNQAQSLASALDNHDGSILDRLDDAIGDKDVMQDGGKILGHIFGDKLGGITNNLGSKNDLDDTSVSDVLSNLAPVVMGQLGAAKKAKHIDADGLGELISSGSDSQKLNPIMDWLDKDDDGSVWDDLFDMGKNILK